MRQPLRAPHPQEMIITGEEVQLPQWTNCGLFQHNVDLTHQTTVSCWRLTTIKDNCKEAFIQQSAIKTPANKHGTFGGGGGNGQWRKEPIPEQWRPIMKLLSSQYSFTYGLESIKSWVLSSQKMLHCLQSFHWPMSPFYNGQQAHLDRSE